ncbi:MAG: hybrid sensor histidine kinase/response regulator [Limisphaerales bacterium]
MNSKPPPSADAARLRQSAEERLKQQRPEAGSDRTEADTQRLLHELQVHQIELEMQNEELLRTGERLESEMEKYSDLYEFAPVGYLTLDPEGAIGEANLTVTTLVGVDRSRLVKRRFQQFVYPGDLPAFTGFLNKIFESQARESCELSILKPGKPAIEVRLEAVAAASGRECRVAVMDITVRKQAEADRLILSKLESTGILAGGIAHDFNNLLAVILMNLELSQTLVPYDEAPTDEELSHRLDAARQAAMLAVGLAQQLITFANGGAPLRKLTFLPRVIMESVRPALSGSRARCEYTLDENLWAADVDAGQIGEVIRNLAANAREAMPDGGVIQIQADNLVLGPESVMTLPAGEYVRVSVSDRGTGIPKELLAKIFDPYFSTKQRGERKGMGLGLTICHSIVQKHGGTILVKAEPGVGSTFEVYLPASRHAVDLRRARARKAAPSPGRILVMDDEEGVRIVVGATLQRMGHQVELAEEGQSAVEVYRRAREMGHPFDAVILDLTVRGGMGGREALQALRHLDPGVKAMVMSGYAHDPVVLEYQNHGFKGALAKPFDAEQLQECLAGVMSG